MKPSILSILLIPSLFSGCSSDDTAAAPPAHKYPSDLRSLHAAARKIDPKISPLGKIAAPKIAIVPNEKTINGAPTFALAGTSYRAYYFANSNTIRFAHSTDKDALRHEWLHYLLLKCRKPALKGHPAEFEHLVIRWSGPAEPSP